METVTGMMGGGSGWAVDILVKTTVLLSVAWGTALLLRRASASARHLVWSAAVIGALGLPIAIAIVPWRLPVLPALPASVGASAEAAWSPGSAAGVLPTATTPSEPGMRSAAGTPSEPGTGSAADSPSGPAAASTAGAPSEVDETPQTPRRWHPTGRALLNLLLALWAVGLVVLLGRLSLGGWLVRRIVRCARPLDTPEWTHLFYEAADRLDLPRAPALLMSDRMPMPFASGLARPAIVLPENAAEWSERRRRMVLCHELAHVRRRDLLLNVIGRLACAVYWFHPLVWIASRRLRAEAERAADDMVLRLGTRASEYAEHLLQIVCLAGEPRTPAIAVPLAQKKEFEGRMMAILEADTRRDALSRRHTFALGGIVLALVLPLAAMGPAPSVMGSTPSRWEASGSSKEAVSDTVERKAGAEKERSRQDGSGSHLIADETSRDREIQKSTSKSASKVVSTKTSHEASNPVSTEKNGSGPGEGSQQADSTDARVIAALLHALEDSVAEVRDNAAYALGKREVAKAVPALARRLVTDESGKVRETSAWALGQIESPDATAALATSLRKDLDASVRATVVWAMGRIEDPTSVPALTAALSDSEPEVRGRAAWALGTISAEEATRPLMKALTDSCSNVRLRAAWALGQIADPSAATVLAPLLTDSVAEVRKAALWALSQLDGDAAREVLLNTLESKDPRMRAGAVRALAGQRSDPWPWPWPDPRVR